MPCGLLTCGESSTISPAVNFVNCNKNQHKHDSLQRQQWCRRCVGRNRFLLGFKAIPQTHESMPGESTAPGSESLLYSAKWTWYRTALSLLFMSLFIGKWGLQTQIVVNAETPKEYREKMSVEFSATKRRSISHPSPKLRNHFGRVGRKTARPKRCLLDMTDCCTREPTVAVVACIKSTQPRQHSAWSRGRGS